MNLLDETLAMIEESEHSPSDITYIGAKYSAHACTWEEFKILANVEYDAGYGTAEVASDLIILFSDSTRLQRLEYDGAESWTYSVPFTRALVPKSITRLVGGISATLAELNAPEENKE